jgi:predicted ATPase/class 3 adenylate cyclase/DNA-binding CsgD family transcriptional regulator
MGNTSATGNLPEGTVTFLFTDLEGSTRLLEAHPNAYRPAVYRHDELLRAAVEAHGGAVFETVGDAVYAAFATPAAVAAALAGQLALQQEEWGAVGPLRARMGLHTGEVERQGAHYFGAPLYRCARLTAAAHGGQVLLSAATATLVRDALPEAATLRDLGEHRLKDLQRPERVFQLVHPALPAGFPPLRTLDSRPNNLPEQPTPLVGREGEAESVRRLLLRPETRLLTLTGPGGVGKTRLALAVAAELLDHFEHGVFFVPLEALPPPGDPDLVVAAVARALDVRETPGRPLRGVVQDYLRDKQLLLVLDNFEQVLPAAPLVGELLAAGRRLKALVTSRALLRLRAEYAYPVPPLALPDVPPLAPAERLTRFAAVRLFVERARAAQPDFALTDATARAVAELCHRLDGLPLAIELAAARTRLLPPRALVDRLQRRLPLLTGGARDLPVRQQTLRAAIGWSYDLLAPPEQALFRRLAVFAGGCAPDAAAFVAGPAADGAAPEAGAPGRAEPGAPTSPPDPGLDVLDGLAVLMDHSLLRRDESAALGALREPRFRMLETVREYALELLEASGEADAIRGRHAAHAVALAARAAPALRGPRQAAWLAWLAAERDNLHAALAWLAAHGDVARRLRLAADLWWFWYLGGAFGEGRAALEGACAAAGPPGGAGGAGAPRGPVPSDLVEALCGAGVLAYQQGEYAPAAARLEASVAAGRELGDAAGVARALTWSGLVALHRGDPAAAVGCARESVALFRRGPDAWGLAHALNWLGHATLQRGDTAGARPAYEESLTGFRATGDAWGTALALSGLANVALRRGDRGAARALHEEALTLRRGVGDRWLSAFSLTSLGDVAQTEGDHPRAAALFAEALGLFHGLGSRWGTAVSLAGVAELAARAGAAPAAARLSGAADAVFEATGTHLDPLDRTGYAQALAVARTRMGAAAFGAARAQGRATPLEAIVAQAQAVTAALAARPAAPPSPLSPREREVAALVARGLTNRQIAAALVITEGTAANHIAHVLDKLGLESRVQIATWATAHGLGTAAAE